MKFIWSSDKYTWRQKYGSKTCVSLVHDRNFMSPDCRYLQPLKGMQEENAVGPIF